jgi:hypothetical protein
VRSERKVEFLALTLVSPVFHGADNVEATISMSGTELLAIWRSGGWEALAMRLEHQPSSSDATEFELGPLKNLVGALDGAEGRMDALRADYKRANSEAKAKPWWKRWH